MIQAPNIAGTCGYHQVMDMGVGSGGCRSVDGSTGAWIGIVGERGRHGTFVAHVYVEGVGRRTVLVEVQ